MTRVLLGQLGSNGDCLYATIVARQIKEDFPGCHLTWAVGSFAKSVLANNPHIDRLWEFKARDWSDMAVAWRTFEQEAVRLHALGAYDKVFITQISPGMLRNFDGTIRPSVLRNYPRPVTVPIENVIRLTDDEIEAVDAWCASNRIGDSGFVVLFECSSKSGQSFVTPQIAMEIAEKTLQLHPNAKFLLSTQESVTSSHPNIIGVGHLSIRDNLRLTHHVDLFVGCGSGLTVVATTLGAKPRLPNLQVLSKRTSVYASFRHDFEHFGKPTEHFLETTSEDTSHVASAIASVANEGFEATKVIFDERIQVSFEHYLDIVDQQMIRAGRFADAASSLTVTAERYGTHPQLKAFADRMVTPMLEYDPCTRFPDRLAHMDAYRSRYG